MLQRRTSSKNRIYQSSVSLLTVFLTFLFLLTIRLQLTGLRPPTFSSADNPTAHAPSLLTRTLSFLYLPLINFRLLLYPKLLSFDWSMDAVPRITSLLDSRNVLTFCFYFLFYRTVKTSCNKLLRRSKLMEKFDKQKFRCVQCNQTTNYVHTSICRLKNNNNTPPTSRCCCTFAKQKHFDTHECLLLCIAFLVLPFLPASNLLFYVGFVVAERILYLPSIGFCFLVALGLNSLFNKFNKRVSLAFLSFLLLTHAARTWQRNEDWRDEERLYRSGIPVNPPKAYGNLGSILSSQGRLEEAEEAFRLALLHRPNMADVHYNLGNLQSGLKRYPEAIRSYEMAIKFRPSLAVSYLNLGHLLAALGRTAEAEQVLLKCSKLESSGLKDIKAHEGAQTSAMLYLSRLYFERGNVQEALEIYEAAISRRAHETLVHSPLVSSNGIDLSADKSQWFTTSTGSDPIPTYLSYGKILMKNRTRTQEVDQWFQSAPLQTLKHPLIFMHYGKFLVDSGKYEEAVDIYLKALQLEIDEYNVVTSAAAILRQAGRFEEAEIFYRKAVSIKPQDPTSRSNLGAILHLKGNYKEAESRRKGVGSSHLEAKTYYKEAEIYYKEALKLNPSDETTLSNLSKLRNLVKPSII